MYRLLYYIQVAKNLTPLDGAACQSMGELRSTVLSLFSNFASYFLNPAVKDSLSHVAIRLPSPGLPAQIREVASVSPSWLKSVATIRPSKVFSRSNLVPSVNVSRTVPRERSTRPMVLPKSICSSFSRSVNYPTPQSKSPPPIGMARWLG